MSTAAQAAGGQQYPSGCLYVVATPIGNLADLSLRAIHVLALADVIACEDTRMTQRLLQHLGLQRRLLAVHEHNENTAAADVLRCLHDGQRVVYVSDAGTPGVSDPGARLVRHVNDGGCRVMPIPGPSAPVTLMSVAGDVGAAGFAFAGFLPPKAQARREALAAWLSHPGAVVLFESPHRIADLANDLAALAPARRITVGRELTKQFEDIASMPAEHLPRWLNAADRQRGEFALVLHAPERDADVGSALTPPVLKLLDALLEAGSLKDAAQLVADATGLPRKLVYDAALRRRQRVGDSGAADT